MIHHCYFNDATFPSDFHLCCCTMHVALRDTGLLHASICEFLYMYSSPFVFSVPFFMYLEISKPFFSRYSCFMLHWQESFPIQTRII
uniref:Uncharacterized protein n=1 Tax=Rhizophora mucronata TaxID=61149 RepID=A0A2P2NHA6_RHIMU